VQLEHRRAAAQLLRPTAQRGCGSAH
jgi:hypothetical protein